MRTYVGDQLAQLGALETAVRLKKLELVAELERSGEYVDDGATSAEAWLQFRLACSRRSAREQVRVARALQGLPAIFDAAFTGRLSWDQLVELTKFAAPETDSALVAETAGLSVAALACRARRAQPAMAEELSEWAAMSLRSRRRNGRVLVTADLPAVEGTAFIRHIDRQAEAILQEMKAAALKAGPAALPLGFMDDAPSYSTRCAMALLDLVLDRGSRAGGDDLDDDVRGPDDGSAQTTCLCRTPALPMGVTERLLAGRPRTNLVVSVDADKLAGEGWAHLLDGSPIPAASVRRLACFASIQIVTRDDAGNPLGIGRRSRVVPEWLAQEVWERDRGCVFPRCGRTRWVDIHHVNDWILGGPTDLENLAVLGNFHHTLVHELGWTMRAGPDGTWGWIRPDGRVLKPGPDGLGHHRPDPRLALSCGRERRGPSWQIGGGTDDGGEQAPGHQA